MGKQRTIKTSIEEIVNYWAKHEDECGLSVDWAEADHRCWRCGCKKNLQRCHIVPDSIGGKDEASNLVLLCKRCHADGPNVKDPEIMWDWIRAYGVPFYDTFWTILGNREYEFIYGHSVESDLKKIVEHSMNVVDEDVIQEIVKNEFSVALEKTGMHFGQPYFNTATVAGVYRMMLKAVATELEVDFPIKEEKEERKRPWWIRG